MKANNNKKAVLHKKAIYDILPLLPRSKWKQTTKKLYSTKKKKTIYDIQPLSPIYYLYSINIYTFDWKINTIGYVSVICAN